MDILKVKKSRIQYYVDMGIIVPLEDSQGPGTNRYFSKRNIAEIHLAQTLTKLGVGIKTNRVIVQKLSRVDDNYAETSKVLKMEQGYSSLTPHTLDFDAIGFLQITFSKPEDPDPHVDIFYVSEVVSRKLLKDSENTSHVLLVNISKIKKDVETALDK